MPPKKKPRLSSRATSTVSKGTHDAAVEDKPTLTKEDATSPEFLVDAWTDEQEISLFKGVVRWKPVGMHKHFRMIALSQHLRNHGFNPAKEPHTRIPGIWKKLGSLYNLEALDEREDSFSEDNSEDHSPSADPFVPFSLPPDTFADLMFAKRLAPLGSAASSSPPLTDDGDISTRRATTVADSEEPRSSPVSSRGSKPTRSTRASRGNRRSRLQVQLTPEPPDEAEGTASAENDDQDHPSTINTSRASTSDPAEDQEDQGENETNASEDENDNEDEEAAETPTAPAQKTRGVNRPTRGGRGMGRGRASKRRIGRRR